MEDFEIGDYVYFARIIPSCDVYELKNLKLRTVDHDAGWFVGLDAKTKGAYLFQAADVGKSVFLSESTAKDVIKEAKKNRKEVN